MYKIISISFFFHKLYPKTTCVAYNQRRINATINATILYTVPSEANLLTKREGQISPRKHLNPTDLMFLSGGIFWGIEVVYNNISAVHNMYNYAVAWKLPFISEGSLAFISFSGVDTEVSRLREGLKHMDHLETTYSVELWTIPCPKTTLSGKFLR